MVIGDHEPVRRWCTHGRGPVFVGRGRTDYDHNLTVCLPMQEAAVAFRLGCDVCVAGKCSALAESRRYCAPHGVESNLLRYRTAYLARRMQCECAWNKGDANGFRFLRDVIGSREAAPALWKGCHDAP